jgi:hypothetical protein
VVALTVEDLATLLGAGSDPAEMRVLLEPGIAADRLSNVLWDREHGEAKRVAVVCERLVTPGLLRPGGASSTDDLGGSVSWALPNGRSFKTKRPACPCQTRSSRLTRCLIPIDLEPHGLPHSEPPASFNDLRVCGAARSAPSQTDIGRGRRPGLDRPA